jgi:intein/homing endonuclease
MNVTEIRRARAARPFRRFRLHLADGRELPVTHPENLMVTSDGRSIAVYIPGEGTEILDVPLLTRLDFRRRKPGR